MLSHKFLVSILVLFAAVALPASASTLTYCNGGSCDALASAFTSATASLTLGPITSFVSADLSGSEYQDASGTDLFGFQSNGTTAQNPSISGTSLRLGGGGGLVEVTLPANTFAFGADIEVTSGSGTFCIEPTSTFNTGSNCFGVAIASTSPTSFVGVVSDTAISTVWLGPSTGSPTLLINSFEIGTEGDSTPSDTPEAATMVLIGGGLICLRLLRRRQKKMP